MKFAFALLSMGLIFTLPAQVQQSTFRPRAFEREFQTALRESDLDGVIVLMMEKGEIVYLESLGETPPDPEAEYAIGRLADTFISTSVLMLQEHGLLDVTVPLSRFLPEIQVDTTPHQLLNHTAGLGSAILHPLDWIPAEEVTERNSAFGFSYCNRCYGLLVDLTQQMTQQPFDRILRQSIFYPLHMDSTRIEDGQIFTTVQDMTHWLGMFLQHGRWGAAQLIQPETIRKMQSPTIPTRRRLNEEYGYGWFVRKNIGLEVRDPNLDRLASAYDLGEYRAQITLIPLYQKGILILSPDSTSGLEGLMEIAVRHFMGWQPPEKNQPESLSLFAGTFRAEDGTEIVIEESSRGLRVRYDGKTYALENPETRQFVFQNHIIFFEYQSGTLFNFVLSTDGVTQVFTRRS
ncbi:MAG: beta-lactamase family protein [Anaerolineae bacterium]|nr:beta-lactamase family protein [Anaerolineae bacterium]